MIYIGIDLHARHFSMAVLNQDDSIMFEETLPTSSQNLKAAIGAFGETKSVVFEESTLAAWAYRVLQPCAEKVVVADPLHNHWIAGDEKSNDITAARKLAQLLRAGLIHPVHHSTQQRQLFKELVLSYHDTSGEVVRFKNKLKAKFRQHGVHCTGHSVYGSGRDEWLGRSQAKAAKAHAVAYRRRCLQMAPTNCVINLAGILHMTCPQRLHHSLYQSHGPHKTTSAPRSALARWPELYILSQLSHMPVPLPSTPC